MEAAQAYAPMPDAQAQTAWAAGVAQAARGAGDCITATRNGDAALLGQASTEVTAAGNHFADASKRIQALTQLSGSAGRHPASAAAVRRVGQRSNAVEGDRAS